MPGVQRWSEQAPFAPFEQVLWAIILPYFRGATAFHYKDNFFVHVLFRLQGSAGRNLTDIHACETFRSVHVNKRSVATRPTPRRKAHAAHVRYAESLQHRDPFALHPAMVSRFLQIIHHSTEIMHFVVTLPRIFLALHQ